MNIDIGSLLRYLARACRTGAAGNYPFYPVRFAVPVGEHLRRRRARRAIERAGTKASDANLPERS